MKRNTRRAGIVLVALALAGCAPTTPKGRAIQAGIITVRTADEACVEFSKQFTPERVLGEIDKACKGKGPEFAACADEVKRPWFAAGTACEVYERVRNGAGKALDKDLPGAGAEVVAAVAIIGIEVRR